MWGGDRRATERYGFYKINLLTGSADPLVVGAGIHPFGELSSNGRLLYYQRALEGLLIARDLESGQERILMSTARDWVYTYRANRDGALAYVRRRKDADGGPVLVVRSPSGSESELLRGGAFDYFDVVDWTPDGNGILYRRAEGTQPSRLWLMPRRGGPPVNLGATLIRGGILDRNVPSLHPNGRALAYQEFVVDSEFWLTPLAQPDGQLWTPDDTSEGVRHPNGKWARLPENPDAAARPCPVRLLLRLLHWGAGHAHVMRPMEL